MLQFEKKSINWWNSTHAIKNAVERHENKRGKCASEKVWKTIVAQQLLCYSQTKCTKLKYDHKSDCSLKTFRCCRPVRCFFIWYRRAMYNCQFIQSIQQNHLSPLFQLCLSCSHIAVAWIWSILLVPFFQTCFLINIIVSFHCCCANIVDLWFHPQW